MKVSKSQFKYYLSKILSMIQSSYVQQLNTDVMQGYNLSCMIAGHIASTKVNLSCISCTAWFLVLSKW